MSEPAIDERREYLASRTGRLVTLIGPAAGALGAFVFMAFFAIAERLLTAPSAAIAADPSDEFSIFKALGLVVVVALTVLIYAYVIGIVPAILAGLLMAAQVRRDGLPRWKYGLVVGTLVPVVCVIIVELVASKFDLKAANEHDGVLGLSAVAAILGFGAAAITGALVQWRLRRTGALPVEGDA